MKTPPKKHRPDSRSAAAKKPARAGGKAGKSGKAGQGGKGGMRVHRGAAPTLELPSRDVSASRKLALACIEGALDKKALVPVLIDVSAMASYTDFIGIVSARSDRQVEAIADNVRAVMRSHGRRPMGDEGGGGGRWTLLDFGDVVIHVFYHPVREFYDLESLWIDAPRLPLAVPPEAMQIDDASYGV